jgi:hypothetical protein
MTPVQTRTGTLTHRVSGTINGNQRIHYRESKEDAEALRDQLEMERISAAAALRPKITRLTKAELENT